MQMDALSTSQIPGYQQAVNRTAYFQHQAPGYLKISGEDQRSFLQRQTSNNIDLLSLERPLVTVLTSPTGRILDMLTVIDEGEKLGIITLPGQGEMTFEFLKNRIFFMDKVTMEDASSSLKQIDLLGPEASLVIQDWGVEQADLGDELHKIKIDETPIKVLRLKGFGFRLLVPNEINGELLSKLKSQDVQPLDLESFELLRIEAGIPAAHHELTEDYTPLETGYQWAVSDDKGCYTGQEVLARQVNYDKITRQMVGLFLSEKANIGDSLYPLDKNQPVGKITSVTDSPRFGLIALAVVKRTNINPGDKLRVGDQESSIHASISEIPFQEPKIQAE
jgi:folate-binding protein YgfZ